MSVNIGEYFHRADFVILVYISTSCSYCLYFDNSCILKLVRSGMGVI